MPRTVSLARRSTLWRWLRVSLFVGALYDLTLSAALLLEPGHLLAWLAVPPPAEAFYLSLIAVFLGGLGACVLLAASDIRRYFDLVAILVAVRLGACGALAWFAWREPRLAGLLVLAAVDAGLALFHAGPWRILRR